jgi:hypothetical protein
MSNKGKHTYSSLQKKAPAYNGEKDPLPVGQHQQKSSAPGKFVQPKLTIGAPNDPYEKEADTVAGKVMRMPEQNFVQRKCAHCEEEEKKQVRRKPISENITPLIQTKSEGGAVVSDALTQKISSSQGSGSSLDSNTQSFMSSRFGNDFSQVKIHTDGEAVQMNRELNAKAFTTGSDIYFNEGQYQPHSDSGKQLLAHELTHTVQQNKNSQTIQRACSAEDQVKYDEIAAEIKTLPHYLKAPIHPKAIYAPSEVKTKADDIIKKAKDRDECLYYIKYLRTLFSTEEEPPGEIGDQFKKTLSEGAANEKTRLDTDRGKADKDIEENAKPDIKTTGKKIKSDKHGKYYYVDSTDVNNIYVMAQVKLKGKKEFTDQVKQMEDGIEKAASIQGYTVNLIFTDKTGNDVFETDVDPTRWPTSGNWVRGVDTLAHELHHMLNLPDRYNYIEDHSGNKKMYIADRIHWFTEEFNRTEDPNRKNSFMGEGDLVMPEDVCKVVHPKDAVAEADCIEKRKALNYPAYGIKFSASQKVQRLIEVLGGFIPPTLLDARADDKTIPLAQDLIMKTAKQEFGQDVSTDFLDNGLNRIRNFIISGRIQMENASDPKCIGQSVAIIKSPISFIICPAFMALSTKNQVHEILRSAYRMYQEFSGTQVYEKMMGRGEDPAVAKQWADFITKAYNRI